MGKSTNFQFFLPPTSDAKVRLGFACHWHLPLLSKLFFFQATKLDGILVVPLRRAPTKNSNEPSNYHPRRGHLPNQIIDRVSFAVRHSDKLPNSTFPMGQKKRQNLCATSAALSPYEFFVVVGASPSSSFGDSVEFCSANSRRLCCFSHTSQTISQLPLIKRSIALQTAARFLSRRNLRRKPRRTAKPTRSKSWNCRVSAAAVRRGCCCSLR